MYIYAFFGRHADLLHFIAQKESKCLELRYQLAVHEAELLQCTSIFIHIAWGCALIQILLHSEKEMGTDCESRL